MYHTAEAVCIIQRRLYVSYSGGCVYHTAEAVCIIQRRLCVSYSGGCVYHTAEAVCIIQRRLYVSYSGGCVYHTAAPLYVSYSGGCMNHEAEAVCIIQPPLCVVQRHYIQPPPTVHTASINVRQPTVWFGACGPRAAPPSPLGAAARHGRFRSMSEGKKRWDKIGLSYSLALERSTHLDSLTAQTLQFFFKSLLLCRFVLYLHCVNFLWL
jgi:hypothetical protein